MKKLIAVILSTFSLYMFSYASAALAVEADMGNGPVMGSDEAPLTLIEFSDYQCPFCARFAKDQMKRLKREYIDTGKVKFVYRDFPLPSHRYAMTAAQAAHCADEQGKYWEMNEALFDYQGNLADINGIAQRVGLNIQELNSCINSEKYARDIRSGRSEGDGIGVRGTPSFVLGESSYSGLIKGDLIVGAVPYEVFKKRIESMLKK